MSSADSEIHYKLVANDKVELRISEKALNHSETLLQCVSNLLYTPEAAETMTPIPVANVDGATLKLVVEWLEHHRDEEKVEESREPEHIIITDWDKSFMRISKQAMFDLICAANYLDIRAMLEVLCKEVAQWIKGCTPDQMRLSFEEDAELGRPLPADPAGAKATLAAEAAAIAARPAAANADVSDDEDDNE